MLDPEASIIVISRNRDVNRKLSKVLVYLERLIALLLYSRVKTRRFYERILAYFNYNYYILGD